MVPLKNIIEKPRNWKKGEKKNSLSPQTSGDSGRNVIS